MAFECTRCPLEHESAPRSHEEEPPLRAIGGGHFVACHLVEPGGEGPKLIDLRAEVMGAEEA